MPSSVLTEVLIGIGILLVLDQGLAQDLPVEAVDTHGGIGGLGNRRLFFELVNGVIGVGVQNAETGSFSQRNITDSDGNRSLMLYMV